MQDMSLNKENPSHFKSGQATPNPMGRPKGSTSKKFQVKERLLGKWQTHPVDKLVKIANALETSGRYEEAAQIWTNLLKYFEPTKKPVETVPEKTTPEESVEAAEETFKLLQELEQHGLEPAKGSEGDGLETGKTDVSPETSSEKNLPGHPEQ